MKDYLKVIVICAQQSGSINLELLKNCDLIIAVDGGLSYAQKIGINPNIIIGDEDSVSIDLINEFCKKHPQTERITLPKEKNDTDTMAAVNLANLRGANELTIIGGLGERLDHTLANLQTLAYATQLFEKVEIIDGNTKAIMIDEKKGQIDIQPYITQHSIDHPNKNEKNTRSWFSVYSWSNECIGVDIIYAKYELKNGTLKNTFPIGTSNEFINNQTVEISLKKGQLLILIFEQ